MPSMPPRSKELKNRPDMERQLEKVYQTISQGFIDQTERTNEQIKYWEMYNCELNGEQQYFGTSKIYLPLVKDAIDARVTRFKNQLFPETGRYVDIISTDGTVPHEHIALAEHYIERMRLKTIAIPELLKNGDVEGQYNLYVTWNTETRNIASRKTSPAKLDGVIDLDEEYGEVDTVEEDELEVSGPEVECIPDADVMIMPAIASTVEKALEWGGSVTILRRWTKERIKQLISEDEIEKEAGERLVDAMSAAQKTDVRDLEKKHVDDAGIKNKGKYCLIYETWKKMKVAGELRLCRIYFADAETVLSVKRNPYWSDLCPLISHSVSKISGSIKGIPPSRFVASLQYGSNDKVNQAWDSSSYSMLPIIMTDPVSNPRTGTMVLDVAAIWEVNPNTTKFAEMPSNWKDAFTLINFAKSQIQQTLSVSPSMIPQSSGGPSKKRSQAEVAQEQQVDLLTTDEATSNIEDGVLTPLVQRIMWLDHQFRDDSIMVPAFGRMGMRLKMTEIKPIQMGNRYVYQWRGTSAKRNAQQVQQMIAGMNVLRGISPDMLGGKKVDLSPIIEVFVEETYGARIAPLVLKDPAEELTVDPSLENEMLEMGYAVPTHPLDDDRKHIQAHMSAASSDGDIHQTFQVHIMMHQRQMQAKTQAQTQQAAQQRMGAPQGGPGQTPPGAQPSGPNAMKGPPGMVPHDQMGGSPGVMPRRM